ncbi:murein biosynthesis integral membrane protein MurJ [Janibacter indicus]|uniref:Murein biosynthesis integral membrane protein MurJ n=1 Tax=Janibacter indicus TaxID=857417 RepID=A0A7L9J0V4_9MICO|nr:lipid II flippase MurJ [Janibacter indicus]QOK22872.1 murein biosynthesis integral membrane protein MurJ [Janibacter indicus]
MSEAATPQEDLGDDAEHRSGPDIGRSSAIMASGTLFSRVLGFARNSLTAYVVGLTIIAADAWNAANTLPNIFHLLIAGGVLNAVIVPQITRAMRDADGGTTYINRLLTLSVTALAVITLLLMLAAPLLVSLVVSSSWPPEARTLATAFAVLCLPQVFFYGLYTLLGQVLTAHHKFGAFMWSPALANLVAIGGLLWFVLTDQTRQGSVDEWTPTMIAVLGGSATVSIALQAFALVPALRSTGLRFRPVWGLRGSGLRGASRMAMWAFAAVVVGQGAYLVNSRVLTGALHAADAQGVEGAGLTAYANAFLLFMLPHGIITVSLVTALFTRISHAAHDGDTRAVTADLRRGLTLPGSILLPGTAAILLVSPWLLAAVLPGTPRDQTDASVGVLVAMMIGLVPYGWFFLVQRAFYAYEDGRTPFVLQLILTGVALTFTFVGSIGAPVHAATWVGLGQTVSNLAAAIIGLWLLRGRLGSLGLARVVRQFVRMGIATALGTLVGWGVLRGLLVVVDGGTWVGALAITALVGVVVVAVALAVSLRLRVEEVSELLAPLTRRLRRG